MKIFHLSLVGILLAGAGLAQEPLPVPAPTLPAVTNAVPLPTQPGETRLAGNPPLAAVRIPATLIAREASETFFHRSPVDRVILGTHSRGTADCHGAVQCTLEEHSDGAVFVCHIRGQVDSQTCGVNGPATIASQSRTQYWATKRIVFESRQLVAQPAQVSGITVVNITGIGSTAPGIRGRLVRRIATRRADSSLPTAEAITQRLTLSELQQHIDHEFDQRLQSINAKLATRLAILDAFAQDNYELAVRSQAEFIEILLSENRPPATPQPSPKRIDEALAVVTSVPELPLSESVVLWLPLPELSAQLSDSPLLATLLPALPLWLNGPLAKLGESAEGKAPQLAIQRHGEWIGFEFDPQPSRESAGLGQIAKEP